MMNKFGHAQASNAILTFRFLPGLRFDGVKTALLANTWRPHLTGSGGSGGSGSGIIPTELARHFNEIVESCVEGAVKPEPDLYRATVIRQPPYYARARAHCSMVGMWASERFYFGTNVHELETQSAA